MKVQCLSLIHIYKLVILLEKEGTSKTNDVFLYILDDKGEILNFQQFIGSGINHAIKLLQDITSYYIVGETTSTDYDYNFSHKYRCGVVFIVDKDQPERFTYYSVIDENYDVTVNDACICDDKLYISTTIYNKKIRARQLELYVDVYKRQLYYNEISSEIKTEIDEDDLTEEIETEKRISGIAIVGEKEFILEGIVKEEKENDEVENKSIFKIIEDENNYVIVQEETETEQNEYTHEYKYTIVSNGKKVN